MKFNNVRGGGHLLVGDWLGEKDGNRFWTNEDLSFWYAHNRKSLKSVIRHIRNFGWNDSWVVDGTYNPTELCKIVNDFRKEIIRRKGHVYFGTKGAI